MPKGGPATRRAEEGRRRKLRRPVPFAAACSSRFSRVPGGDPAPVGRRLRRIASWPRERRSRARRRRREARPPAPRKLARGRRARAPAHIPPASPPEPHAAEADAKRGGDVGLEKPGMVARSPSFGTNCQAIEASPIALHAGGVAERAVAVAAHHLRHPRCRRNSLAISAETSVESAGPIRGASTGSPPFSRPIATRILFSPCDDE